MPMRWVTYQWWLQNNTTTKPLTQKRNETKSQRRKIWCIRSVLHHPNHQSNPRQKPIRILHHRFSLGKMGCFNLFLVSLLLTNVKYSVQNTWQMSHNVQLDLKVKIRKNKIHKCCLLIEFNLHLYHWKGKTLFELLILKNATVVELVDTRDLKSLEQ